MGSSGRIITTADILDGTVAPVDLDTQSSIDRLLATNTAGAAGWRQLDNLMVADRTLAPAKVAPGGTPNTVMRTTDGTNGLFGKIQPADMDALPGSAVAMLLDYKETADLYSGSTWAANTAIPFGAAKSFTVQSTGSIIEIGVRCGIFNGTAPAASCETSSYLVIDGATRHNLGASGSNATGNPFAGSHPVFISGLAPGAHTVQVFTWCNQATNTWYLRCATQPGLEWFHVQVIEHKIGLGIKGDKGDTGASAQTAGGPRLAQGYTHVADISALALATGAYTTFLTMPAFTVDSASSLISVSLQVSMLVGGIAAATFLESRLLLDGTTAYELGGGYLTNAAGYLNPAVGGSTIWLGSLAPGTHTLAFQIISEAAGVLAYMRPTVQPREHFQAQVVEHKLGGTAWLNRGTWVTGTTYNANDVVAHLGASYVALRTSIGQNPLYAPADWMLLAAKGDPGISITWRGGWSAGTAYAVNDVVTNAGITYICVLASTGHNPASDGGVHWQVMVAPGSMINPMTTADDIIVGGGGGAPTRMAKGANNRVFGVDASGVLGYRQINDADVAAGANIAWEKLKGQGYPMTVPGSVDGTVVQAQYIETMMRDNTMPASKIVDGTVTSAKIADGTIVGGDINSGAALNVASLGASGSIASPVFGTPSFNTGNYFNGGNTGQGDVRAYVFRSAILEVANLGVSASVALPAASIGTAPLADASVTTAKIAQRGVTGFGYVPFSHAATAAAGSWTYYGGGQGISGTAGQTIVVCVFTCTIQLSVANALLIFGIGVDTTGSPAVTAHASVAVASGVVNASVVYEHTMTAAYHTYYPLVYCNAGSMNMYGTSYHGVIALHR